MKTSAWFVVCMAVATCMSALTPTELDLVKCRDYAADFKKDFTTTQLIEHDLVNGNWTGFTADGVNNNYLFTEEGLLQIISTDRAGHQAYRSTFWRVAEFDGQPFLVVSDDNRKEKLLLVSQTCEGLTLQDVVNKEIFSLDYQPLRASAKRNLTKAYLIGEWTNVSAMEVESKSSQAKGAFLQYQFSTNGTYACYYGNNAKKVFENGSWEISKDNQFLLLHVADGDNLERTKSTQVIRIAQVDDHGLVLEQVMKTSDVNEFFGANNKTFAFIR
jgi:hypothetical protein